jgi:hypothetical protein
MKISMDKKYTSNGKAIRILCTDRNNTNYPVMGLCNNGSVWCFKENGSSASGPCLDLVEVWEPQVGEYCWFWDYEKTTTILVSRFVIVDEYGKFKCKNGSTWDHCAKFVGELPDHLKGL